MTSDGLMVCAPWRDTGQLCKHDRPRPANVGSSVGAEASAGGPGASCRASGHWKGARSEHRPRMAVAMVAAAVGAAVAMAAGEGRGLHRSRWAPRWEAGSSLHL